jgi:hypothetical protein
MTTDNRDPQPRPATDPQPGDVAGSATHNPQPGDVAGSATDPPQPTRNRQAPKRKPAQPAQTIPPAETN